MKKGVGKGVGGEIVEFDKVGLSCPDLGEESGHLSKSFRPRKIIKRGRKRDVNYL